jgi:hypothetical protein
MQTKNMKKIRKYVNKLILPKKQLIFSYGNIINPKATIPVFGQSFPVIASVFIKGFKLILKQAPNAKNGYHNIICTYTGNEEDIIPGFLTEVPKNLLPLMDLWESSNYQRQDVVCYTRFLEQINCQMYLLNQKIT